MELITIFSLVGLCIVQLIVITVLIIAWIKLNRRYKEHLQLWGSMLSLWEEASSALAQVANKERVLMYASEEAGTVARIAKTMLEAMVVASSQIGDSTVYIQAEKIVRRPPAQNADVSDEE